MNRFSARSPLDNEPVKTESGVVNELFLKSASASERAIAWVRITLVALMLIRFVIIDPPQSAYWVALPAALLAIGFSVVFLVRFHRRSVKPVWLWISVLVDSVTSFAILLNNVLTPWEGYPGCLFIPDTAILLIITFAAGFRLSTRIALFGGIINMLTLAVIIMLEFTSNHIDVQYEWSLVVMWYIMLVGAMLSAMISAWRTRSLSVRGAYESVRLERVRSGMETLLQSHHDAHSLLASVHLNTDQLVRKVQGINPTVSKLADEVSEDLRAIKNCLQQLKQSADGELKASLEPSRIELNDSIDSFIEKMRPLFPAMEIVYCPLHGACWVSLAGGEHSIRRILMNLVENAKEGNGRKGATRVEIDLKAIRKKACITVTDDGPGFDSTDIRDFSGSDKVSGYHVGIASVQNILQLSGGTVELGRSLSGGAQIKMVIPIVP